MAAPGPLPVTRQWRAHGGIMPNVSFDQQLDNLALWIETWSHAQRCELIEKLLLHMENDQFRFLWTVMQPSLHRDFMYSAQIQHPSTKFQPLSTHTSRKLREKLKRNKRNSNLYRVKSAYCEFPEEVLAKNTLPELQRLRQLSFDAQANRRARLNYSAAPLPRIKAAASLTSSLPLFEANPVDMDSPLLRFTQQPVRRHIQNEALVESDQESHTSISLFKSLLKLPPNAARVVGWYTSEWDSNQRNEFLHKLLLKLDERQHFFISNLMSVKQYKDFITLLPVQVALKILSFLAPKQLIKASRVCKSWKKMCERNELWKNKCKELNIDIRNYQPGHLSISKVGYKKLFRDYLGTLENWDAGKYKEMELKGHSQNVQCVSIEVKGHRLASGSADKSIKVWDMKSGACLQTLKGHTKGVWCLNFYTGSLLISGSYDSTIRIWNLNSGKCVKTLLGHNGSVWSICRRGNTMVSGSQDRSVKMWDVRRCLLEQTLMGHQAAVFCVDMDETGEHAFSSSADHTVRIWSFAATSCIKVIYVNQSMAVMTVSYNKGYLACSFGEFLCVYKFTQSVPSEADTGSVVASATGLTAAASSDMSHVKLMKTYEEHHKRIESVRLTMNDTLPDQGIMVSAGKDGLVKYWSLREDKSVQTFEGSKDQITCITFDNHRIVLASKDNKIKIFDFTP